MRTSTAAALVVLACAGCSGGRPVAAPTTTEAALRSPRPALQVGVVGPLAFSAPAVVLRRGTLAQVAGEPVVLLDARTVSPAAAAAAARAHPRTHYALVGASAAEQRAPNLVGLVLDETAAARVAGRVAGVLASAQAGGAARIAWVGPQERRLAEAFGREVHVAAPSAQVLHQWSQAIGARCKQAALTALDRGAVVVVAHRGICGMAAVAAAHERNEPAFTLADFELPGAAASTYVRAERNGLDRGGEDIVFGVTTGAIGLRAIDPLVSANVAVEARAAAQDLLSGG